MKYSSILKSWFPFAAMFTLVCGIVYIVLQQNYRQTANDFQLLMADDAAFAISRGVDPKTMTLNVPADMAQSISPWVIVYDDKGNPVVSGVTLDGKVPKLPAGVLQSAKEKGTNLVTWQPRAGIRQALVVRRADGNTTYFVASGRSLSSTEERIALLGKQILLGWLVSLFVLFAVFGFLSALNRESSE